MLLHKAIKWWRRTYTPPPRLITAFILSPIIPTVSEIAIRFS